MKLPLYVMKHGASNERTRDEVTADAIYRAAGVAVPWSRYVVDENGVGWRAAEYVAGVRLGEWMKTAAPARAAEVARQIRGGFAADVLLGNDDVIGQTQANVIVDRDGVPWRVDNGWALGGTASMDHTIHRLRHGAATQSVYGLLTHAETALQVAALPGERILALTPPHQRDELAARLAALQHIYPL